jgi:large subunit ribosomal protein L15
MDLSNLRGPEGATKNKRRVGRGQGSTLGKTAGRGQKGQKSRSGGSIRMGFEGGQMPLQRRLPKQGFSNHRFKKTFEVVNLGDLEGAFNDGDTVTLEALYAKRLVRRKHVDGVKVLGKGELTKKLTVQAHAFSGSAAARIAELGGTAEVIARGQ